MFQLSNAGSQIMQNDTKGKITRRNLFPILVDKWTIKRQTVYQPNFAKKNPIFNYRI